MFNKSIAYRLSIYISLAVISVFIAFMVISYLFNSREINKNIENDAKGLAGNVIMQVEEELVTTREMTEAIAELFAFYGENDNPELLITGIMNKYQFLNAVHVNIDSVVAEFPFTNYFGFRDTDTIIFEKSFQKHLRCEHEAELFKELDKNKNPGWSGVFRCPRSEKLVVSYYYPLRDKSSADERVIGEVICELSLLELNQAINNIPIGKNGYAVLFSQDGQYLSHPNKEYIFEKNINSLSDKVFDKNIVNIENGLEAGTSGFLIVFPESRNFEKHWAYYTRLNEIDWTLVFLFPYNELFTPLYLSTLVMLFFSVLGTLVIYLIITYITNRLIEPLSNVATQLKRFTSLGRQGEKVTSNEVMMVAESLNSIVSWYEKFKISKSEEKVLTKRRNQDLIQASEIQKSLIKTNFSELDDVNEIDIYAIYKPAKIVSGDLFDYFFINDDHLMITMGDVSGKGVPAALFMSVAQTLIKNSATSLVPRRIVKKANEDLFTINQHQFFLTLFLGILNLKTGILEYCNAAHTPAYILKQNGEIVELAKSHGLPLGLYANKQYSDSILKLDTGDSIILYTDGITDLQNENGIQFGNERFIENIHQLVDYAPKELVVRVEKSLEMFRGNQTQTDDITLMVVQYKA